MNITKKRVVLSLGIALAIGGCATTAMRSEGVSDAEVSKVLHESFTSKGQATMDRLDQDEVQRACSEAQGKPLAKDVAARLEKSQAATIKYPADGHYLGDWKNGEKIAQSGVGKQYSDDPKAVAGGNCYACHQLAKHELAYGTIGPSLYNFGKIRGYTPEMQRYAFAKVYNSEAFAACSQMPRFGHMGILTEQQIKDVVALLMDPKSPVNQ
jgi:sulfur-oxidizing protein SoxX